MKLSDARVLGYAALLLPLAGCAGDVLVELPVHEPRPGSPLAEAPAVECTLDVRPEEGAAIGGKRTTVGGVGMGAVEFAVPPSETLEALFRAELEAAGHRVTSGGAERALTVVVESFSARTPATALYWDVTVEAAVALEPVGSRYEASSTDRTYSNPSGKMITRLAEDCLGQLAAQFREDPAVATFLAEG
ncbi:MAG: hypothetical protein AAGB93_06245 [Planctomycetota bacterium]